MPNICTGGAGSGREHEDKSASDLKNKENGEKNKSSKISSDARRQRFNVAMNRTHIDRRANQVAHGERAAPRVIDGIVHAPTAAHAVERRHKVDFRDEVGGGHARLQDEGLHR